MSKSESIITKGIYTNLRKSDIENNVIDNFHRIMITLLYLVLIIIGDGWYSGQSFPVSLSSSIKIRLEGKQFIKNCFSEKFGSKFYLMDIYSDPHWYQSNYNSKSL